MSSVTKSEVFYICLSKRKYNVTLIINLKMIKHQFFRCGKYSSSQMNSCHWQLTKHFYKTASSYPMHYLIALILVSASQKRIVKLADLNNK